jgi:hypothetical protein
LFDAVNWKVEGLEESDIGPVRIIDSIHSPETEWTPPKKCVIIDGSMGEKKAYAEVCSVEHIINNLNRSGLIMDRIGIDCLESIDITENYEYVCVFREKNCELGTSKSDRLQKSNYYIAVQNLLDNGTRIQNIFRTMEETHTGIAFSPLPIYFLQNGRRAENNSFWCTWEVFRELYKSNLLSDTREKLCKFVEQIGYNACVVMSDAYAGLQWSNSETIIGGIVKSTKLMLQSGNFMELKSSVKHNRFDLIRFAQQHSRLAVYGIGDMADVITDFFDHRCLEIEFYIVSDGHREKTYYRDKKVWELSEVKLDNNIGIVIALNKKNTKEVVNSFDVLGFSEIFNLYDVNME